MNNKMNKKGQIAIFIIVGLLILLVIGLSLLYIDSRKQIEPKPIIKPTIIDQTKLQQFVDQCLVISAIEGMEILRLQGGYIDNPPGYIVDHTDGTGYTVVEGEDGVKSVKKLDNPNKVHVWITQAGIMIPSLEYMAGQLEDYVKEKTVECVNDFEEFKEQGLEVIYTEPKVKVDFGKTTAFFMEMPITGKTTKEKYELRNFIYLMPVNMQKIHEVSTTLALTENNYAYLESHAKSLISLYGYTGGGKQELDIPPISFTDAGTQESCDIVKWTKSEVKDKIKRIFASGFTYIKMAGTKYEPITVDNHIAQGVYDGFVKEYLEPMPNVEIKHWLSPEWDMSIDIKPSAGDLVMPDQVKQTNIMNLPLLCNNEYEFKYDIAAPVLVTINDLESATTDPQSKTLYPNGYSFNMFMIMYLCGNQERTCVSKYPASQINLSSVEEGMNGTLPVNIKFCDPDTFEEEAKITVKDSSDDSLVSDVGIFYRCGNQFNDCYLGQTSEEGVLESEFPSCINGEIYLQNKKYSPKIELLTLNGEIVEEEYNIDPKKKIEIKVELIPARTFAQEYYFTRGFTENHACTMQDANTTLDALKKDMPKEKDLVMINLEGAESVNLAYPAVNATYLAPGKYDAQFVYMADAIIMPSTYGEGDHETEVGLGNEEAIPYNGSFPFGENNYQLGIENKNFSNKQNITFYLIVEHLSTEILEVKDLSKNVIKQDGTMIVPINPSCSNGEVMNVTITKGEYSKFLEPELK